MYTHPILLLKNNPAVPSVAKAITSMGHVLLTMVTIEISLRKIPLTMTRKNYVSSTYNVSVLRAYAGS